MPAAEAAPDDLVPAAYVPGIRGYVVMACAPDQDGADHLAVWRLSPIGVAAGAWVLAADDPLLLRVMESLRGCCLVDWDTTGPAEALRNVKVAGAGVHADELRAHLVLIPDLLEEIRRTRQRYEEALEQHRRTATSALVPLAWSAELPEDTEAARRTLTPARVPTAGPAAAQALMVAGAVQRAIGLWQDTEQVRYRRSYLRSLGDVQPLPPDWSARLRAAAGTGR